MQTSPARTGAFSGANRRQPKDQVVRGSLSQVRDTSGGRPASLSSMDRVVARRFDVTSAYQPRCQVNGATSGLPRRARADMAAPARLVFAALLVMVAQTARGDASQCNSGSYAQCWFVAADPACDVGDPPGGPAGCELCQIFACGTGVAQGPAYCGLQYDLGGCAQASSCSDYWPLAPPDDTRCYGDSSNQCPCAPGPGPNPAPDGPKGSGRDSCGAFVGSDPIFLGSHAAMTAPFSDFSVDTGVVQLDVTRQYTSDDWTYAGTAFVPGWIYGSPIYAAAPGILGRGWHDDWDLYLSCSESGPCSVWRGVFAGYKFQCNGSGTSLDGTETWDFCSPVPDAPQSGFNQNQLIHRRVNGEFILYLADGREFHFNRVCDTCSVAASRWCGDAYYGGGVARLTEVVDAKGNSIQVTYDRANKLLFGLADSLGHTLQVQSATACTSIASSLVYDGMTVATYGYRGSSSGETDLARATDGDGNVLQSYAIDPISGRVQGVMNESGDTIAQFSYDGTGRATGVVDKESSVAVNYDAPGGIQVTEFYGSTSATSLRTLDQDGKATSVSDGCACGPARTFTWTNRRLTCVADAANHITWQQYDAQGRLTYRAQYSAAGGCPSAAPSSLDPTQSQQEWYDYSTSRPIAQGLSIPLDKIATVWRMSTLNPGAKYAAESFVYDPTPQSYDPAGYACQQAPLPVSSVVCRKIEGGYTFNAAGSIIFERHATFYSYDANGRVIQTLGPVNLDTPSASDVTPVEVRTYRPNTDTLPRRGRLYQVMRYPSPTGTPLVTTYDYDAFGPSSITHPNGGVTTIVKDGRGRPILVVSPDGGQSQTRYHDGLDPSVQILATGGAVQSSYDSVGRLASLTYWSGDPAMAGATLAWGEYYTYDAAGNRVHTERRNAGGTVTWQQDRQYDVEHRLLTDTNPDSPATAKTYAYDVSGSLARVTDEQGRATSYGLDGLGRVSTVTRSGVDPTGASTSATAAQYAYQPGANTLSQVTDARGLNTTYQYDDFGRLMQLSSSDRGPLHFIYDARGNILQKWDNNVTVSYTYDGLDRPLTLGASNSVDESAISYTYGYDAPPYQGHLTSVVEPDRTMSYGYDVVGRLTSETMQENGVAAPLETQYSYDNDGDLTGIQYPSGLQLRLTRDPATRQVTQIVNVATGALYADHVAHWPGGPAESFLFGNGLALSQTFDHRYEPLSVSSGPLSLTYTLTPAGDIGGMTDQSGDPSGCVRNASMAFGYDFIDRLISWSNIVQAGPGVCAADNLGLAAGFNYVAGTDQIASQFAPDVNGQATFAFGYDNSGDVSAIGQYDATGSKTTHAVCLRHDALGRLVLVGSKGTSFPAGGTACLSDAEVSTVLGQFKYDARNRRVARQQGAQWTYVVSDSSGNPLSELTLTNGAWSKVRDYVWLDGRLLAQVEYSGSSAYTYYAHLDHLGTPRALTNANGQLVWSTFQRPYGEIGEKTGTDPLSSQKVVTNLRLPGQYDERLFQMAGINMQGPYYNWNRWYLPSIGRYLGLDPLALNGSINGAGFPDWYNYADGNPLRNTDRDGTQAAAAAEWGAGACGLPCAAAATAAAAVLGKLAADIVNQCRDKEPPKTCEQHRFECIEYGSVSVFYCDQCANRCKYEGGWPSDDQCRYWEPSGPPWTPRRPR